ncbi:glycosyltransferase [Clostridium ljungdahlii]|uniref:SPBc2 prophage-derived glycosyltransferase SunS n=1 Tax=Clostridium ljungdahlii TaxID=1538 RepID=A0A162KS33_9CLOT|nr:glycosyltransferase [Clostridium ljungdahlii]OAA83176.1 SPBc2 prophage-derived glycosyltransferase SunS [Clostridium ljungdahlii]
MKITACLITKNEEKNIKRCIDSFKEVVDQIIVVDTGSTDNTISIAKEYGAEIYNYVWKDDFSQPRNLALSRAKGDWIIFLDADEYFYGDTSKNILKIIKGIDNSKNIIGIYCPRINIDTVKNIKVTDYMVRIFRNKESMRYLGRIHENVYDNGKKIDCFTVDKKDITIYHTGYSSEILKSKYERNLFLLQKDVDEGKETAQTYFYFGDCYFSLENYELAIKYMKMYIDSGEENGGYNTKPYYITIASMMMLNSPYESVRKVIDEAIAKKPSYPEFYRLWASLEHVYGSYDKSLELYKKAFELNENYNDIEHNNFEANVYNAYYNMGRLYELENDNINALEHQVKSLQQNKYFDGAFQCLLGLIKNENYSDIILFINSIYDIDNEKDIEFLVNQTAKVKLGKVLYYYENIRLNKFKKEDNKIMFTLYSNENYEEAYKYFSKCYFDEWSYTWVQFSVLSALLSKDVKLVEEIKNYVKPSFKRIIEGYFENRNVKFIKEDKADYLKLLKEIVLVKGNSIELKKFIELKNNFEENVSSSIGNILFECKQYIEAVNNYNDSLKDAGIYYGMACKCIGVCYFKMKNYETSMEYMQKAVEKEYKPKEVKQYLIWLEKKVTDQKLKIEAKELLNNF